MELLTSGLNCINCFLSIVPSEEKVNTARQILLEMEKAAAEGKGAVSLNGRMIDAASIRQAQVLVDRANQIKNTQST